MKSIAVISVILIGLLTGCGGQRSADAAPVTAATEQKLAVDPAASLPAPIQALIKTIQAEEPTNPPSSLLRYQINGRLYFYRPSYCCDFPSVLYNEKAEPVCEPDGGFTGRGDGRCEWFSAHKDNGERVWSDKRNMRYQGAQ